MKIDTSRYKNLIRENLQQGKKSKVFSKAHPGDPMSESSRLSALPQKLTLSDQILDREFFDSLHALTGITGKAPQYHQPPGLHPDFAVIKSSGQPEFHYVASMFIDIRRSTRLFARYDPFVVANITTAIQRLAIHLAWYFDGYVQRYHGDGLLVYFGGKNMTRLQATQNAILTASFFSRFIKEELPDLFLEQGIENIYTRVGIDVGEDDETLWYLAGMGLCSEVTTCSLHTSLAAHMQGCAKPNGIVVGDNVKSLSTLKKELFSILKDKDGKENRYIFSDPEDNFYYTQWAFDWDQHLKNVEESATSQDQTPSRIVVTGAPAIHTSRPASIPPNTDYLRQQASSIRPYSE